MSLPRVITVDPTWTISRIMRAAFELTDTSAVQVDVSDSAQALQELSAGGCQLMLVAFEVDEATKGFELAARVARQSPDTAVIVLGDVDDPDEFDDETAAESPFVYLRRPVDAQRFLRVMNAGLRGGDLKAALNAPVTSGADHPYQSADVPRLEPSAARPITERLLVDVGAMAIVLANRQGEVVVESGATGYLNRERLTATLTPAMLNSIDMRDIVGGQLFTLQFYDGDDFDLFVLSVGLHHFLSIIFDGQSGSRQFGAVNRFGRKAVEDLIALIGANAFFIQRTEATPATESRRRAARPTTRTDEIDALPLERAMLDEPAAAPTPEPEIRLEPIAADADELADLLSGDFSADLDADLFNLDEIEEIANQNQLSQKGKLGWDDAKKIGLF